MMQKKEAYGRKIFVVLRSACLALLLALLAGWSMGCAIVPLGAYDGGPYYSSSYYSSGYYSPRPGHYRLSHHHLYGRYGHDHYR